MIEKKIYPDGTFYPVVKFYVEEFTFRINNYSDLWFLQQVRDIYKANGKNAIVTIPNLLDGQADDRFSGNESFNLKLICEFLNIMQWKKLKIFHPHNSSIVKALIDNVEIIDNTEFVTNVIEYLNNDSYSEDYKIEDNLILMSTDSGGFKPLMKLCDNIGWKGETFSASKSRKYIDGKSVLHQEIDKQDFKGKDILIIDDILIGGNTFLGIARLLENKNIGNLYLAVSHTTISSPNKDLEKYFKRIFTTNSKNLQYNLNNIETLTIFNIKNL